MFVLLFIAGHGINDDMVSFISCRAMQSCEDGAIKKSKSNLIGNSGKGWRGMPMTLPRCSSDRRLCTFSNEIFDHLLSHFKIGDDMR